MLNVLREQSIRMASNSLQQFALDWAAAFATNVLDNLRTLLCDAYVVVYTLARAVSSRKDYQTVVQIDHLLASAKDGLAKARKASGRAAGDSRECDHNHTC